jgi:transketolase C-terminal domain/subunit
LAAYEGLKERGIQIRVIDAYSVKPLDAGMVSTAAYETEGVIVVEDHAVAGGLGDAVAALVGGIAPVYRLGVQELPRSGPSAELLDRTRHFAPSSRAARIAACSLIAAGFGSMDPGRSGAASVDPHSFWDVFGRYESPPSARRAS